MSNEGLSTGKTVAILATVVICLSVLWPKCFYPMFLTALNRNDDTAGLPPWRPPRGAMAARLAENGRSIPNPSMRGRHKDPAPSTFNVFMPVYTMVMILVFVFMIFKIISRSSSRKTRSENGRIPSDFPNQAGQRVSDGVGQNNNFEGPKRNRKNLRDAFLNNTERILRTYGREKMVDALNVVVHELAEYQRAIELSQQIEDKILEKEAKIKRMLGEKYVAQPGAEAEPQAQPLEESGPDSEAQTGADRQPEVQGEPETEMMDERDLISEDPTDSGGCESDSSAVEVVEPPLDSENVNCSSSQSDASPEPIEKIIEATELSEICRNSEGLQFIDHVTEIKPGESLSCYDELIYGESVAAPIQAPETEMFKDYEHWQSISPEELFQATSFETTHYKETARSRNLRRRKHRNFETH
ncbi:resistance to inhibitors of cholinesterase protein 3 [Galendromus occidentalis]|uniref:Resistance to inhibitors of cholinesterase protein 3 n=1 Tax=Galendromus occidentalis TaxID=34638 RepID=A0AAJ7SF05_9ACAR|nr:resistance to inhibitors of cholinesterase protein 3 [Galendromus occidentalis]